jgi:hypothetical protein
MYYFTPKNESKEVQKMLDCLGVKVIHFNMEISKENKSEDFKNFYRKAIKTIEEMIKGLKTECVE